jgi:hypothetical protein
MNPSSMGPVPAELPQEKPVIDCGVIGPMPQQAVDSCHGNEMHPQGFVQLVGCHDPNSEKHEAAHHAHLSAA